MSDILNLISIFTNLASILLALLGLYFVYENWRIWKRLGLDIIKAKAFLNKEFLEWNWICLVVAGGLIMSRRVYKTLQLTKEGIVSSQFNEVVFDIIGLIVIILLVLMAYQWYRLIHEGN